MAQDRGCRRWPFALLVAVCATVGCRSVDKIAAPSNFRSWSPDQAVLPYAEFHGDQVTVRNIRYCKYLEPDTYVVDHYDKTINLRSLKAVDFFMVPFKAAPSLAHTMLSFEFIADDGRTDHLAVSVEIRREVGETYLPWKGSARQYEIMYVAADERDVVQLRANHRDEDVYLYRSTATPEQARLLFVDVMQRTNELATQPEFYDTITNNCTTNIVRHINRIKPNRLTYDWRVLLPGYSDHLAYEQGLIQRSGTFEETQQRAYLNAKAQQVAGREDYSRLIRQ
ncbi:MAG: DUF4105 domain-containing protein [Pirellulales bacterium]